MAGVVDILMGKSGDAVTLETDAGRQHLANGSYDSVPYNLYRCVYSDGTIDESLSSANFGGEVQRTIAINPAGTVVVAGKLNHPFIP